MWASSYLQTMHIPKPEAGEGTGSARADTTNSRSHALVQFGLSGEPWEPPGPFLQSDSKRISTHPRMCKCQAGWVSSVWSCRGVEETPQCRANKGLNDSCVSNSTAGHLPTAGASTSTQRGAQRGMSVREHCVLCRAAF